MNEASSGPSICRNCGASRSPFNDFCQTCHIFDQWQLAVETSNIKDLINQLKENDIELIVHFIRRLREKGVRVHDKAAKRKSPQEFDFALQEIEKTTRGLELTSIEAVGVLEMVKQSFIEEMLYEDYGSSEGGSSDEMEGGDGKES